MNQKSRQQQVQFPLFSYGSLYNSNGHEITINPVDNVNISLQRIQIPSNL